MPELTSPRLIERIVEALEAEMEPAKSRKLPRWTLRVMRILKKQFIPREIVAILSAGESVFAEGVAVAWVAEGRDLMQASPMSAGKFARELINKLTMSAQVREVVARVESGEFTASEAFQKQVMKRLFTSNFAERRAFAEGLAVGNRLRELLEQQIKRSTTDATGIYLMLWLYWPEIGELRSVGEVATVLEPFFIGTKGLTVRGNNWEERMRKLANRIELSFRAKQKRIRISKMRS